MVLQCHSPGKALYEGLLRLRNTISCDFRFSCDAIKELENLKCFKLVFYHYFRLMQ